MEDEEQRACEAEALLRKANEAYHNGTPIMEDAEYDNLWRGHQEIRRANPSFGVWDRTILNEVGAAPRAGGGFATVRHDPPMQSLDNLFAGREDDNIEELKDWLTKTGEIIGEDLMVMEPKIDGIAVRLIYNRGKLLSAVTRGNGELGEDITLNVIAAKIAPLSVPELGRIQINAEIYMKISDFNELNRRREAEGKEPAANPRNAAAGIISRLDPRQVEGQGLSLVAHGIPAGSDRSSAYSTAILDLFVMGIVHPQSVIGKGVQGLLGDRNTGEEVKQMLYDMSAGLSDGTPLTDIPIDGAVFKVDNFSLRDYLGSTSRAPRWAVALKFKQQEVITTVHGIGVQVGRTGVLTPVAILDPVTVDGSVVSRASLHNESQINRLRLLAGDRVVIRKAGAIIPEVVRSVDGDERESYRGFSIKDWVSGACPSCGSRDLVLRTPKATGKTAAANVWVCNNPTCTAQLAAKIEHMASRNKLDIDQLGAEACDAISESAENEGIHHHFDVLSKPKEFFADLQWTTESGGRMTFGESRASKVMESIRRAKEELPLNRWIAALGIPSVGDNTSKEITRLHRTRMELLHSALGEEGLLSRLASYNNQKAKKEFEQLRDEYGISSHLGPVSIVAVVEFLRAHAEMVSEIPLSTESNNYLPQRDEAPATGPLSNMSVVITGTLSKPRDHFKALVEKHGGKVAGSVSGKTDLLLAGEKAGSKLAKAEKLGVRAVDEAAFMDMLKA